MTNTMSVGTPAVIVAERDGTIIVQNAPARRLMGKANGKSCWDAIGGLEHAEGLPCRRGCVGNLLSAGVERSQDTFFELTGQRHHLACIPVDGVVVCVLSHGATEPPEQCEGLTPREREVLQLLADGETTPSAATRLGIRESTLRTHVEKMRVKLGVGTRAALVALGFRRGYLE